MAVKKSRIFPGFTFALHLQKGMHRSKPGMWKGSICQKEGTFSVKNGI